MTHRILVVDDEAYIREMILGHLVGLGYDVDSADALGSAISQIEANGYDLIITDKNLPDQDGTHESGMSLIEFVSKHHPDTGILMVTGYPDTDTAVEAIKMGAFDYLVKPFSMEDLQSKVERALDYRSYVDPKEIMDVHQAFRNEVLFVFNNMEKLTREEVNRSIGAISEKVDYFFRAQNKLLERNQRQREALDTIKVYSEQLSKNTSDEKLVSQLIDIIVKEAQ